ncbi:hypothetical protein BGZ95_006109 [Linnemannia exigua]|uniref:Uncharacterized protein n=1 Tax=Linnemannia exigua TaxID=604196 RepID=A0AAD4D1A4_9FUNG|nr:hypothetical protein BGZ95_006109 [Linnemannia exigua]
MASYQTNTSPSMDDQALEDDIGLRDDPHLIHYESGPTEDDSSSIYPLSTLTVESFDALVEPPTTKKAQATLSDNVASDFSSSVLPVDVKADATHLQRSPDNSVSMLNVETWSRSQLLSGGVPNLQSHLTVSAVPPSHLEPTAPQLIKQPRKMSTPIVTRQDWSPGTLQRSQETKLKDDNFPRIAYNSSNDTDCPQATVHSEPFATNVHADDHSNEQ